MTLCLCATPGKYEISPVRCNLARQVLMLFSEMPVAFVNKRKVELSCHASLLLSLFMTNFAFNMKTHTNAPCLAHDTNPNRKSCDITLSNLEQPRLFR